jgi:hypothetical protein
MSVLRYSITQKEQMSYCEKRVSKLILHSNRFLEFRALSDLVEKRVSISLNVFLAR